MLLHPPPMSTSDSSSACKVFDYSGLDDESRLFIQQQTGEIWGLMKRTAQSIVEIGQRLINVKARLGHGYFEDWLRAEFEWTHKTATRFMNVAKQFKNDNLSALSIAPSALYELAAPSTSKAVRSEAIARAEAGESITYTIAKEIKKKYTSSKVKSKVKPKSEQTPVVLPPLTPTLALPPSSPLEIVAIRPSARAIAAEIVKAEVSSATLPQRSQPVSAPEPSGNWWQLRGRHLLYCGDPNSDEFLGRVTEEVQLLLAFPPTRGWLPTIQSTTSIITSHYLPQGKDLRLFEDTLETNLLLYSNLEDLVVSCFLPSLEILSIINRLNRRGLLAEPDSRRCSAIVADWKRSGLKAERVSKSNP